MYTPDCFDNPKCAEISGTDFRNNFQSNLEQWMGFCKSHQITNEDAMLLIAKFYGENYLEDLNH
jgi:hypothetical protein